MDWLNQLFDLLWWHGFKSPKNYTKEKAVKRDGCTTKECAEWSNEQLRANGYKISGDAWTRSDNEREKNAKKIISGYTGLSKPKTYSYSSNMLYLKDAASNVEQNLDTLKLHPFDFVGLYSKGSPNSKNAYEKGVGKETLSHTGHIIIENGTRYVVHNVHGDILKNKLTDVLGPNHTYGIVSVYRPIKHKSGGRLNYLDFFK